MNRDDWFRNKEWNDKIAANFEAKLKGARRKGQYLRIKASTLAHTQPQVALALLDKYFSQDDRFDDAQAHVDRASALVSLGRTVEALSSYEEALNIEAKFPNLLTQAYLELPYLVSVRGLVDSFDRALEALEEHRKRLILPVDHFKWNAAQAIIVGARGDRGKAREFAAAALEAASKDQSGFRYHPTVGLVSDEHMEALRQLREYCD